MRPHIVLRYIGLMLLLNSAFMLVSAVVSMVNGFDTGFYPLLLSFLITSALGTFPLIFVPGGENITSQEGYGIVVGSWLIACMMGMLPYLLWGGEFTLINAWFESVSGYTTTGSSILNDVEALPKSMLLWRSSTHWLGGVGVVMFSLLVLPSIAQIKMRLSNTELSTIAKDNFRYRTQKIVQILLVVYIGLTVAETVLLRVAGMTWFDAVNNAFSTIATGGFSTKNQSIAYYNSLPIEVIIMFFMAVSGIHFGLIFSTLTGRHNNIFRSEVTRFYVLTLLGGGVLVALSLWAAEMYPNFLTALRYSLFQVISVGSTTGYATADSSVWTPFAIMILILVTLQCACAGSTSGGIKVDRFVLAFKAFRTSILQRQHPNAIIRVKMNGVIQDNSVVNIAVLFIFCYVTLVALGALLICAFGVDVITSFGISIASAGNVGPGLGAVGSMSNYHALPGLVKLICTALMLLGRLEIFGFIQLFFISRWS